VRASERPVARAARLTGGVILCLAGILTLLPGTVFINDHRYTAAFGAWQRAPSASTEAAWRKEGTRVARLDAVLQGAGFVLLLGGAWLILKR
jgi:hypothetical protein